MLHCHREHLGEDIILIEQIVNHSVINLYIRSVYQDSSDAVFILQYADIHRQSS